MNEPPKVKVFLEGRYRKLSRDLPQTVFYCPDCKGHPRRRKGCERCEGFGTLSKDSVQQLVAWVAGKAFGTRRNKFHGAGREDVDVRMLGRGRPFVLELEGPKVHGVDLAEVEAEINRRNEGRLEIEGLHFSEKARVALLKETPHAKRYGALVEFQDPVGRERLEPLVGGRRTVVQKTPKRVAHRRADKDRERWIEFESFEPVGDEPSTRWNLALATQHGTYVKEVLSGEDGMTVPSLSELVGTACRCVELDVLEILGEDGAAEVVRERPPEFGAGL
ncbi:MAG: tRNA pseudouridine(54/55) synthase Pus10 [Planctomycetota bacterium]